MEVSGWIHVSAALPLETEHSILLDRIVSGPLSRSGCCGEEKNFSPSGNRTSICRSTYRSIIPIQSELS
jgi:hypothetical protein